jgi:PKD domain
VAVLLTLFAAIGVGPGYAWAASTVCHACGVTPDQRAAAYRGSLLLPAGTDPGLTAIAARCDGCSWLVQPKCRNSAGTGDASCVGAAHLCPRGAIRMELFLLRPAWPRYRLAGDFCLGPGAVLTPVALVPGVRDQFVRFVPALAPSFQPSGRGIVNLPVLFTAGQPRSLGRRTFALGGYRIDLDAQATWHWEFGDGTAADFTSPGGVYPDESVAHAYPWQQTFSVTVMATWTAEFWVDGAGPFDVTGPPLTQTAPLAVPVKEAHVVLVE